MPRAYDDNGIPLPVLPPLDGPTTIRPDPFLVAAYNVAGQALQRRGITNPTISEIIRYGMGEGAKRITEQDSKHKDDKPLELTEKHVVDGEVKEAPAGKPARSKKASGK